MLARRHSERRLVNIDRRALRRAADRAAQSYDQAAILAAEVGDRLLERLELIRLDPRVVVDVGCGTGRTTEALLKRYRRARTIGTDLALQPLRMSQRRGDWRRRIRGVCADAEALPLADGCCDLLFSNLMLYWCPDPRAALAEFNRILRPGGVLMFATLGRDTLKELRDSWRFLEPLAHTLEFSDMHDLGDALLRGGWAQPVMDMEILTVNYPDPAVLLQDLRQTGETNCRTDRRRSLTGPGRLRAMKARYADVYGHKDRVPATWEIVYGHAWRTGGSQTTLQPDGVSEVRIGVDALRATVPPRARRSRQRPPSARNCIEA